MTKVDKKIASSETTRVNVGHGLRSKNNIQTANSTACMKTKLIDPAKAVIRSATRSCKLALRFIASSTTAGWWAWPLLMSRLAVIGARRVPVISTPRYSGVTVATG
jgi:hypothetical protein